MRKELRVARWYHRNVSDVKSGAATVEIGNESVSKGGLETRGGRGETKLGFTVARVTLKRVRGEESRITGQKIFSKPR